MHTVLFKQGFIAEIRDILLGIYRGSEQQLGDWGFEENFTTPPPTPAPTPGR